MVVKSVAKAFLKSGAKSVKKSVRKAKPTTVLRNVDTDIADVLKLKGLNLTNGDTRIPVSFQNVANRALEARGIAGGVASMQSSQRKEFLASILDDPNIVNEIQYDMLRANYAPRDPEEAIESLRSVGAQTRWGKTERTIQGAIPPRLADKTFEQGAESWEGAVMAGTTKSTQGDDPFQIRNFGAAYAPRGQTTKVGTRKTTGRGITQEGNTRKINEALATADWITPEETKEFGRLMAQAAADGMDGDHIVEVARVANAVRDLTPEKREAYFKIFENSGIHLGNHPKNIQKLSKELNQVVKPAQIRELDNALRNMDKRSKTLLEDIIFSPKANPTQFPEQIQRHIARSAEIGITEPVWKNGSIDYTWRPESNTGQIDIPPQSAKGFKGLRDEFFEQIEELPSGSVWELNPKFKDEKRRRIYARLFGNDPRITRNPDPTLGWVLKVP